MKAKQVVYLCAGLLMLAVVYSLAAARAGAQGGPSVVALLPTGGAVHGSALDSSGRFFYRGSAGAWHLSPTQAPPGTPVDVMLAYDPTQYRTVHWIAMANGDVYTFPEGTDMSQPFEFTYLGNVFGASVQVESSGWTNVKSAYRSRK